MYTGQGPVNKDKKIIIENKVNCGCCPGQDGDARAPGEEAYGYFYLSIPGGVTVVAGADVPLNNAGATRHTGFSPPQAVIESSGDYAVFYGLNLAGTPAALAQLAIAVNGVPRSATFIPLPADTLGGFSGDVILSLNSGDVVTIRNVPGSVSLVLAGTPFVGAQLKLNRL